MKHAGKLKTALLAGVAAALVLSSSLGTSMSYFTTYVSAKGSKGLRIERTIPSIEEDFDGATKVITIGNDDNDTPCYVRVKVFCPIECNIDGGGWFDGEDGYWYYSAVLNPKDTEGSVANTLRVTPNDLSTVTEDFNIIVEVESAAIFYNADGTPQANGPAYVGWDVKGVVQQTPAEQP